MKIDWNIAPDATHYDKRKGCVPAFMRKTADGSDWEFRKTNGEWMHYGPLTDDQVAKLKVRPAPWTGEGLPPVDTVCEFNGGAPCPSDPWHPDLQEGDQVKIIAYFHDGVGPVAVFTFKARNENIAAIQVEQARPGAFRPIRTPEQIAAEERDLAIKEMLRLSGYDAGTVYHRMALALYEAGYRKQVKP